MSNDANRVRVAGVLESTLGTTPGSPRMRTARITGESLSYAPQFLASNELRSDRMTADSVQIFQANSGGLNIELSFPTNDTFSDIAMQSAMFNSWVELPFRYNDGTADSVITDIATTSNTAVVTTGAAFVVGHLIRLTGFLNAPNAGLFPVTTGGATSVVSTGSSWTAETAPPAAARIEVVGMQGTAADITATAGGLASTTLNFVTCGVVVGMWLKVGGTGSGFRFANETLNDWIRVTAVTATAITADNKPPAWTSDAGTGKTIRIFMGDGIVNGVTRQSLSIERGYLGQTVPSYVLHKGMVAGSMSLAFQSRQMVTGAFAFDGTTATLGTVANGTSYDAATTESVLSANVSVGRIAEAGTTVTTPNYIRNLTVQLNNNLRVLDAVGSAQAVDIAAGECTITGTADTYYGDTALYTKLLAGTASNLNARATSGSRAIVLTLPRLLFTGGSPNATGKNTDVVLSLAFQASIDATTNSQIRIDRLPYWEA